MQPPEPDERLDRAALDSAHEAELLLRERRRGYTSLDRPIVSADQRTGDGSLLAAVGFGEPAQSDESRYRLGSEPEAYDYVTLPAPLAVTAHPLSARGS